MNISEFRSRYPAYDDLSDGVLADALYNKYYTDLDRSDFNKAFLGVTEQPQGFVDVEDMGGLQDVTATTQLQPQRTFTEEEIEEQGGEFVRGLSRGVDQLQAMAIGGVEVLGELTGFDTSGLQAAREEQERQAAEYAPPSVPSYKDIQDGGDLFDYVAGTVGGALPATLSILGAGIGVVAAAPVLGVSAGVAGTLGAAVSVLGGTLIGAGDVYSTLLDEGVDQETASEISGVAGPAMGFLELIPFSSLAKNFIKAPVSDAVKESVLKRLAKGFVKTGTAESVVESLQEGVAITAEVAGTGEVPTYEEAKERLINSALSGFLVGSSIGAGAGVLGGRRKPDDPLEGREDPAAVDKEAADPDALDAEQADLSPSERLAQRLIQDPEIDFRDAQVGEQSLLNLQIDQFESQGRTKLANMANQLLVVDDKGEYIVSNEDAKLQLTGLIEIFKMNQGPQANEVDPDFENVFGEIRLATKPDERVAGRYEAETGRVFVDPTVFPLSTVVHETVHHWDTLYSRLDPEAHKKWSAAFSEASSFKQGLSAEMQSIIGEDQVNKFDKILREGNVKLTQRELVAYTFQAYVEAKENGTLPRAPQRGVLGRTFKELSNYIGRVIGRFSGNPRMRQADAFNYVLNGGLTSRLQELKPSSKASAGKGAGTKRTNSSQKAKEQGAKHVEDVRKETFPEEQAAPVIPQGAFEFPVGTFAKTPTERTGGVREQRSRRRKDKTFFFESDLDYIAYDLREGSTVKKPTKDKYKKLLEDQKFNVNEVADYGTRVVAPKIDELIKEADASEKSIILNDLRAPEVADAAPVTPEVVEDAAPVAPEVAADVPPIREGYGAPESIAVDQAEYEAQQAEYEAQDFAPPVEESPTRQAEDAFRLPPELAKSAPMYSGVKPNFSRDYDRAAYIIANTRTKSSAHLKFVSALESAGLDAEAAVGYGNRVVKPLVKELGEAAKRRGDFEYTVDAPAETAGTMFVPEEGSDFSRLIDDSEDSSDGVETYQKTGAIEGEFREQVANSESRLTNKVAENRVKSSRVVLSKEEKGAFLGALKKIHAIGKANKNSKLEEMSLKDLEADVRNIRAAFPPSDGWVPIEFIGVDNLAKLKFRVKKVNKEDFNFGSPSYRFNTRPGKKSAAKYPNIDESLRDKMAVSLVNDLVANRERAKAGDPDAMVVERQSDWYFALRNRLRTELGGFGDVIADALGATSPQTPVMTNFESTVEGVRRFVRGDYDKIMQRYIDHLDSGGTFGNYDGPIVLKESGKKFGVNSEHLMKAFADVWRTLRVGMAPKARNFSGNLIGSTDFATVDVWAARYLRRKRFEAFDRKPTRLPTVVEKSVSGTIQQIPMETAAAVSGEFGFGQAVFEKAAQILKEKEVKTYAGRDFTDADLQALTWFIEKALWRNNNWTSELGEGGSFEQELDKFKTERFLAGIAIQEKSPPSDRAMAKAQKRLLEPLLGKRGIFVARANPTIGRSDNRNDRAFDLEVIAEPKVTLKSEYRGVKKTDRTPKMFDYTQAFDPNDLFVRVNEVARDANQLDAFVSQVLTPKEASTNPNARPGVEIYFKDRQSFEKAKPLLEKINKLGPDGFTLITDFKATQKPGVEPSDYVGVRMQFIPEIEMRFDTDKRDAFKQDPVRALADLEDKAYNSFRSVVDLFKGDTDVVSAQVMFYDTQVTGKESYQDVFNGKIATSIRSKFGAGRSRRSINDHVSERIRYLEGRVSGAGPAATTGDVSSGDARERSVIGDYNEILTPLTDPKDERLASRITPRLQQNLEEFKVSAFDKDGNVVPIETKFVPEVDLSRMTQLQSSTVEKISPARASRVDTIWGMFRDLGSFSRTKWVAKLADPYNALLQSGAVNSYMMSRIAHNMSSTIGEFIVGGPAKWTRNGFVPLNEKGLPEILEPIARRFGGEGLHLWGGYMQAFRARRLLSEGREKNFTPAEVVELLQLGRAYPEFETARQEWLKFNNRVLDVAVDSGYLSAEQAARWKQHGDYIPFFRVDDEAVTNAGERLVKRLGVGSVGRVSEASRRLMGSNAKVNAIIPNMILNTEFLLTKSMRNYAAQRAVEEIGPHTGSNMLTEVTGRYATKRVTSPEEMRSAVQKHLGEDHPLLDDITAVEGMYEVMTFEQRESDKDQNVVHVRGLDDQGNHTKRYYEVNDPLLFDALTYVPSHKLGKVMKVLNWQRTAFSQMITKFPDFMIANFIRDTMSARAQYSGMHSQVLGALGGIGRSLRSDGVMRELRLNGGTAIGGYHTDSQLRRYQNMTGDMDKNHLMISPKNIWAAWDKVGEALENANRIAVYKAAKSQGKTGFEAGFNSRDVLDFSLSGESQLMKFLITTVPFLNARIQGLYKFARSGTETFGGKTSNRANFWMYTSLYGLAASALYAINEEDERYQALSDTAKDLYLHIYLDKIPGLSSEGLKELGMPPKLTIPKPFEVGLLGMTLPERLMQQIMDENAEGADFGKALAAGVVGVFKINPFEVLGPVVKGIAEDAVNFNAFRMRNIVPKWQEDLTASLAEKAFSSSPRNVEGTIRDPYGSELMHAAARKLNIAPQRIQNALDSWFPKVGNIVMGLGDMYYRSHTGQPPLPRRWNETLAAQATIGRFVKKDYPVYSQQEGELRELSREISAMNRAIRSQATSNRVDPVLTAKRIYEANKVDVYFDKTLKSAVKNLSNLSERRRAIDNTTELTDKQKLDMRDDIDKQRTQYAASMLKYYRDVKKKEAK